MNLEPLDRRKLLIALVLLGLAIAAGLGLAFTARHDEVAGSKSVIPVEEVRPIENACASSATFEGLKQLIFDQARRLRTLEQVNFDILASGAVIRMEDPVVRGLDERLHLTRCSGRFILELPPGAEAAFHGEHRLAADTVYEIQTAADGSGPVYRMSGVAVIVSRLAAFDMEGRQLEAPAPAATDSFSDSVQPLPAPPTPQVDSPSISDAEPSPAVSPSFDCRDARSRGELLVCGSERLAARDRSMAALEAAAMADGDRRTRRRLARTGETFLAYRDGCADSACVAQAYEGRMREIRDIMADTD